jgi:hypothetical protein
MNRHFEKIKAADQATKGKALAILGAAIILLGLVFSEGYVRQAGFLGSLPRMYVEIYEGNYVTRDGRPFPSGTPRYRQRIEGVSRGRVRVPLKYLLGLGIILAGTGWVMVALAKSSKG